MKNHAPQPLPRFGQAAAPEISPSAAADTDQVGAFPPAPPARERPPASVAGSSSCAPPRPVRPHERLIRIREVVHRVGCHRGTIYKWIKQGRFPRQVALGANSAAWYESEIDAWVADPGGWRAAD